MSIHLTPAASQRVRDFLSRHDDGAAFRLGIKKTGCSGWGYTVGVADQVAADDALFEQDGVRVVVDAGSLPMVQGTEIDFVRKGLNSEFVFRNPNAAAECGCGESFTTAADKA